MRHNHDQMLRLMGEFMMCATHRNLLETVLQQSPDNITAVAEHEMPPSCPLVASIHVLLNQKKTRMARSHPLHKTIHHALLAGLVEMDGQLVAVDGGDVAVAEFQVKHALADREIRGRAGGFGDQFAFDNHRF